MKKRLTKKDIVREVCRDTYNSKPVVERIIDSTLKNITIALSQGEKVQFEGFGTFEQKKRNARVGRNPHTKEAVPIPARIIPSFKPGNDLKAKVCRDIK